MLQQTQVKTVIPFWNRWLRELPTIEAAAKAPSAKIHKLWEGLGYYTRVRNLQKAAQIIVAKQGGKFPEKFEEVLALPGIGRYTAGAICSIAFNQAVPILDGNVIRVLTRIFGIAENPEEKKTNERLWQWAEELVICANERWGETPGEPVLAHQRQATTAREDARPTLRSQKINSCSHLNQSLMELGALVCTPRNPQCQICPVKKLCVAFKENRVDELPNLAKHDAATTRRSIAFAVEHNGHFLVQQRPAGVVNAHLWEFPNAEITGTKPDAITVFKNIFGIVPATVQPLCMVKHSITRYRITLEAFIIHTKGVPLESAGVWKTPAQMRRLAFTAAHKKLASAAAKSILSDR
jgi:A/G-specific adenine glycosylase